MVTCSLDVIKNLSGSKCSVSIDHLGNDLLKLFLTNHKVNFKLKEVLRHASVYISKILRNDLIEQESSECRLYKTGNSLAVSVLLLHSDLDLGLKFDISVLISKDCFINTLKALALAKSSGSLLCKVVNTKYHILCRYVYRAAV